MPKFSILVLSYSIEPYAYMIKECEKGMKEFCEKDADGAISFLSTAVENHDSLYIEESVSDVVISAHLPYDYEDNKRRSVFQQVINKVNKYKCLSAVILLGDILSADFKGIGSPIKKIPVLFTLCNTPHELEKNQYHLWAPLISIVARKAAITAISDSCRNALIIRNKSDENDTYSKVSYAVFTKYFEYLGGKVVGDQSFEKIHSDKDVAKYAADCVYITGFGNDYHSALVHVLGSTSQKIYTDQAFLDRNGDREQRLRDLSDNFERIHCFDYQANQSSDYSSENYGGSRDTGDISPSDYKFSLFCKVALKFLYSAYKLGDLANLSSHPDFSSYVTINGNGFLISKTGRLLSSIYLLRGTDISSVPLSNVGNVASFLLSETNLAVKLLESRKFCVIEKSVIEKVLKTVCRQIAHTIRPNIQFWELGENRTFKFSVEDGLVRGGVSSGDVELKGIFDLASLLSKTKINCVQINISEDDIEDNDVFRLYVSVKGKLFSINHYLFKEDTPENVEFLTLTSRLVDDCVESKIESDLRLESNGTNKISEILESLKLVAQTKKHKYVYIFLRGTHHSANRYSLLLTKERLSYSEINVLQNVFTRVLEPIQLSDNLNLFARKALESAVGSIMSRNGSHNIGSHVLAALSHNVGTMPDDRVLYQYIQHRMDYIATATTEFPVWRQPTMLVSNIIREFLRQKHLLDYISGSEGLHAYNFQGHFASIEQENSIRVHVRRVEQKEGWETNGCLDCGVIADFIVYPGMRGEENIAKKVDFEKDLAIAIPGGTVGNHAFFTIIENVLRNAAKHEWAVAVKYWKKLQEEKESIERLLSNISESKWSEGAESWKLLGDSKGPEDIEGLLRNKSDVEKVVKDLEERLKTTSEKLPICKPTNLDLYVDFADNPEQGIVECRVWTNIAVKSREYQSADLTALKKVLEGKIGASFIDDETGRLRKENWGIAEMRISAGYLQGRDIADIGGLTSREKALEIIRPVIVSAGGDVACLGYRFDVYKPRELLVVIKDSRSFEEADILSDANTKAMQYGIVFKRESEVLSAKSNPYSYVLFEELNLNEPAEVKKYTDAKLPYRVLGWRVQQVCEDKDDDKDKVGIPKRLQEVACYNGNFFNKDSGDVLEENLGKICDGNNDGSEICYSLLEEVYGFWLDKIRKIKNDGSNRKLVLDLGLKDDKSGARKSLVSDYDLLKFVFAHTFGAAVRSFLATKNEPEVTEECAALLLAIISMPNRQLASVKDLAAKYSGKSVSEVSPGDEHELLSNEFAIVYNQIGIWAEELLKGGHEVVLAAEGVPPNWWVSFENKGWIVTIDEWDVFSKDKDNDSAINKLIEYILAVILKQAEAFLRKYEEEIATLPKGFSIESNGTSFSWEWDVGSQEIEFTCDQGERNAHVNEDFCYFRHGEKAFPTLIDAYYEALSGAQSSFNALVPFKNAVSIVDMAEQRANGEEIHDRLYLQIKNFVVRFMTGLVENSTFKILIIDERVKKFMDDHPNVGNNIGGLGIVVRDHNDNAVRDMFSDDQRKNLLDINFSDDVSMDAKTKVCLKTFDIIVIHQGIIDKLLKNHESKESVGTWLAKMESLQSYVVITTGRGTPANIPDEARVLPYSVIESSILQRFPEKMILVDTIMNLLPSVKEN